MFEVKWADCREKLGADIEGSMTKSILESHKILDCQCCEKKSVLEKSDKERGDDEPMLEGNGKRGKQFDESQAIFEIPPTREN